MQFTKWEYQNLALAAIAQSATLVNNLALRGSADPLAVSACVDPLFEFNPRSIGALFPNPIQYSTGLRTLQEIFSGDRENRDPEVIRYLLGILALRQKLMSDRAMQEKLQQRLMGITPLSRVPEDDDDSAQQQFFKQVAEIYQDTISTYAFRIHVKGNLEYLRNENVANRVRTLLLAGIRWAVLWYQIGGRRWHLVLYRKKIDQTVGDIRRNLLTSV
ncbi:MAG: high frequency lysogenization protein HflD [Gammaproteobacteria bacterium]|nr:high frequency lysogenization protein HflD [Pseudomonadales bacterium]MCP5346178.1 high frequency lysogenization protein HflD [Pseudomonadales bacterium]